MGTDYNTDMNRKRTFEDLELRQLCASDWHNAVRPCDADRSQLVAPSVLTALLGNNVSFVSSIDPQNAPSQRPLAEDQLFSRQFTSFNQAASEAGMTRIYGGIHFGFDDVAGLNLGSQIGVNVLVALTPRMESSA